MALFIQYQLVPGLSLSTWGGGIISVGPNRSLDVKAALTAGSGTIAADNTDQQLINALSSYPPLVKVGTSGSGTLIPITSIVTATLGLAAPTSVPANGEQYWQQDTNGQFVALWLGQSGGWTPALGAAPYLSLTCSAAAALTNNVETAITFDTVREDTEAAAGRTAMWTAGNPTRAVIPRSGVYRIEWRARFVSGSTTGTRHWWILKNGVTNNYLAFVIMNANTVASTSPFLFPLSTTDRFITGDYVEFGLFQNSGGSLNFDKFDPMVPEARVLYVRS